MSVWAPDKIDLPSLPNTEKAFDVKKAAKDSYIDRTRKLEKPPFCLSFLQGSEETGVLTLGDFSLVTGGAKSRKTFLTSMIVAAVLNNEDLVCGMIRGNLPEGKRGVLYLDTEQSDWHAQATVKRAEKLSESESSNHFHPYMLRDYSTKERKALLEYLVSNTPELGFVVIDGIRDLVTSINDEAESTEMVSWIMNLSKKHHCHILCVIHENKVGGQIRGHLGTELQNKAQSVISVKKVENDNNVSVVSSREARDKNFREFAIYFNEDTKLPDIDQEYEIQGGKSKGGFNQQPKKKRIYDFTKSEHCGYLKQMFSITPALRYSDVVDGVKHLYPGILVNDSKTATKFFLESGYLVKEQTEKDSKSIVYRLSDMVKEEIAPF